MELKMKVGSVTLDERDGSREEVRLQDEDSQSSLVIRTPGCSKEFQEGWNYVISVAHAEEIGVVDARNGDEDNPEPDSGADASGQERSGDS